MKSILLSLLAVGGFALTGCETTVVAHQPYHHHNHVEVLYTGGRPYYYVGAVRYWGYPPGYVRPYGYGYHSGHSRNVEVERNTYVVNNNRTVYVNRSGTPSSHGTQVYRTQGYRGQNAPVQTTTTVKKKKKVETQYR